jgi:hypothetical protein
MIDYLQKHLSMEGICVALLLVDIIEETVNDIVGLTTTSTIVM